MRKEILLLVSAILLLNPVTALNSQTDSGEITIEPGEEVALGDYTFRYEGLGNETIFRIHHSTDSGLEVLKNLQGQEIFDAEGESFEYPEKGIFFTMREIGFDSDGRYVKLGIDSSQDIFASSELTSSAPDRVIASREGTVDVPLVIENTGTVNQTFALVTETDSALTATFNYQGFNVSEVYVPAGESRSLDARIEVPEETSIDTHGVKLFAENRSRSSISIDIKVKGNTRERRMEYDVDQNYAALQAGQETTVTATVRNSGEAELQDINVTAAGPEGWDISVEPSSISSVRSRYGRETARITISAPADAEPGDHIIETSAGSERISSEPREIRVQVREKSGLSSVGALLMLLSLSGLIAVYWVFGRR